MYHDALVYQDLCLLSYFEPVTEVYPFSISEMIESIQTNLSLQEEYLHDPLYEYFLEDLFQIDLTNHKDTFILDYFNDNKKSGLAYYVISYKGKIIIAIRGSESYNELRHTTWSDWKDNVHMFYERPTAQQLYFLTHVTKLVGKYHEIQLCGHSKGGNLALFALFSVSEETASHILKVVTYNACGLCNWQMKYYKNRLSDENYLNKITLYENEHDCVSALFNHVKEPVILKSVIANRNLEQLILNHQLYFIDKEYKPAKGKSLIPKLLDLYCNNFYVYQSKDKIEKHISIIEDYFNSNLTVNELYKVFLYHIGKYTKIFNELTYEEMKELSFDYLLEKFKKALPDMNQFNLSTTLIIKHLLSIYEIDKKALFYDIFKNVQSINEKFIQNLTLLNPLKSSLIYTMKTCSLDDIEMILDLANKYPQSVKIKREDIGYFLSQPGSYYLFFKENDVVGYCYYSYIENNSAQLFFWVNPQVELIKLSNHMLQILKDVKKDKIMQLFIKLKETDTVLLQYFMSLGFVKLPFYDKYALLDKKQIFTLVKTIEEEKE